METVRGADACAKMGDAQTNDVSELRRQRRERYIVDDRGRLKA
jgi:hypothetical protein